MIEKMKYVNLTGSLSDLDRIAETVLGKYQIHLEHASKELASVKGPVPFTGDNPYAEPLRKAEELLAAAGPVKAGGTPLAKEEAVAVIDGASDYYHSRADEIARLKARRGEYVKTVEELGHFTGLDFPIEALRGFNFINYQFGRLPVSGFKQLEAFFYDDPELLLVLGSSEGAYQYCVYFAANMMRGKVDSVFSSLHFEKRDFPLEVCGEPLTGKPAAACDYLQEWISRLDAEIADEEKSILGQADDAINKERIAAAHARVSALHACYEARRFAAVTANKFYILAGWMTERDAMRLQRELDGDEDVVLIVEDDNDSINSRPPTKLRNPRFIRPFEFFVKMYGLPAHNEIDPTPFVAVTYTLLFGIMFGDIGHGAVLLLLGLAMWRLKGMELGKILCVISFSSMAFGAMYGSVFGYEGLEPLWMHPADGANITTFLVYAVALGAVLIVVSMLLNLINAFKRKDAGALLGPNGLVGLVFYVSLIAVGLSMYAGNTVGAAIIAVFIALPLLLIGLREPIVHALQRRRRPAGVSMGMYIMETVIELFEVLLSYFTNTLSFIRVGAFALSHASIMGVVWMLSESAAGSNNPAVLIFGNLLVIALEGLIAGIQVLRLEFYEMFSRFYEGGGKAFTPNTNSL